MTKGRKAKPIEEKRRIGTDRDDRTPAMATTASLKPVDVSLLKMDPDDALLLVVEASVRWMSETDLLGLVVLRKSLAALDVAEADGAYEVARKIRADVVKHLSALGLDPTARSRLGVAEIKAASKLDAMETRARERQAKK